MDDTYFDSLARLVNEEPVQTRDKVAIGQLRSISIEKGKEFKPDAATRAILKQAAAEVHTSLMQASTRLKVCWPGLTWGSSSFIDVAVKSGFTFETKNQTLSEIRFWGYRRR